MLTQFKCNSSRGISLESIPKYGMRIAAMMLDVTLNCNLNCSYCFKKKENRDMPLRVAQDAIVWLIYASGQEKEISVQFMGGEPLLRLEMMKELIPFAQTRAKAHGKKVNLSVTTNTTLVTESIVQYACESGLKFHLSVDGIPEIQNNNRPLASGMPSSPMIETAIPVILKAQPAIMARGCVTSHNVQNMFKSFNYFRDFGFTTIGLFPCEVDEWTMATLQIYEEQLSLIGERCIGAWRSGIHLELLPFCRCFSKENRQERGCVPCGAGRGMVLIDVDGGIWPCSRFESLKEKQWQLGSIYEGYDENIRKPFVEGCPTEKFYPECKGCVATRICEGGCIAENLVKKGDMYVLHPNDCELQRILARVGSKVHDIMYAEKNPLFMKKYYPKEWKEIEESADSHE